RTHWLSAAGLMTQTIRTEHAQAVVCCLGESRQGVDTETLLKASGLSSGGCHGDDFDGPRKMSAAFLLVILNMF
ncbi:hypothetical protein IRJ41_022194, partial [Triplophysa rosa]